MGKLIESGLTTDVLEVFSGFGFATQQFVSRILGENRKRVGRCIARHCDEGFLKPLGYSTGQTPTDIFFGEWFCRTSKRDPQSPTAFPRSLRVYNSSSWPDTPQAAIQTKNDVVFEAHFGWSIATAAWLVETAQNDGLPKATVLGEYSIRGFSRLNKALDATTRASLRIPPLLCDLPYGYPPDLYLRFLTAGTTMHVEVERTCKRKVLYERLESLFSLQGPPVLYVASNASVARILRTRFSQRGGLQVVEFGDRDALLYYLHFWVRDQW